MEPYREKTTKEVEDEAASKVAFFEAEDRDRAAMASSSASSGSETVRGKGIMKYDSPASFALEMQADAGEEALRFCDQCRAVLDLEVGRGHKSRWAYNEETQEYGIRCVSHINCHTQFCTGSCLDEHLNGVPPKPEPEPITTYKQCRTASMAAHLCLLQAMECRRLEEIGQRDQLEKEIAKRREAKAVRYAAPDRTGSRPGGQYEGESERGIAEGGLTTTGLKSPPVC